MDAQEIITEVSEQLNDLDHITWTEAMLRGYINSAQKMITSIRPDASSITTTMQLGAGTKQALPTAALRLLEVIRNMGTDGNTAGRVVRSTDHETLKMFDADWHTATPVVEVKNFSYNEKTPDIFYVDPPSDGTNHIELAYSIVPAVITANPDVLSLKDIYKNHIVQWCMFKAYSVEVDSVSSVNRAMKHEDSFYQMMGKKFQRDVTFSPSVEVAATAGGDG
jgi:hypothetical protein